jgi:nucleoside-diphosphate-sugar epimerase
MERKVALVAGATGIIGRGLVEHLSSGDEWEVVGLSRNATDYQSRARFLSVDLLDPEDCKAKLGGLGTVTHLFFAAYVERPTEAERVEINVAMLRNVVETVEAAPPGLRQVVLMQGTKYYGCHLGPFKTPAKESDPRHMPPNFYYSQEDYLRERQRDKAWSYTVIRPDVVCGPGTGHPMNLTMVLAVYATISRELGLPLRFPGKPWAYRALAEVTDTGLLARASEWVTTEPRCANEAFNIINGDYFRWVHLWPRIAEGFGMKVGPPVPLRLAEFMADKGPLWDDVVRRHGLRPYPYEQVASWPFGDFVFGCDYDVISDMTKARRYGFHEAVDTEEMFARMFLSLKEQRYIPSEGGDS